MLKRLTDYIVSWLAALILVLVLLRALKEEA